MIQIISADGRTHGSTRVTRGSTRGPRGIILECFGGDIFVYYSCNMCLLRYHPFCNTLHASSINGLLPIYIQNIIETFPRPKTNFCHFVCWHRRCSRGHNNRDIIHPVQHFAQKSSAHSISVLTFPNNIYGQLGIPTTI